MRIRQPELTGDPIGRYGVGYFTNRIIGSNVRLGTEMPVAIQEDGSIGKTGVS